MRDNSIAIESGRAGSRLRFAPRFNSAAAFIDRHLAEGRSAKIAIRTVEEDVSYSALAERVARCANALLGLGMPRGSRLLMATLDGPAFFYLFWGAIKAGIVPVPLNTLLRAADYAYFIEDSECAAIAFSPELAVEIEAALGGARHRPHVVLRTSGEGPSLSAVMGAAASELEPAAAGSEDDCYWLYSSGSTGRPKGVVHSHRTLALTGQHYAVETLGAAADDVFFSAAKLFFSYGLGNAMSFPLWTGGTSILMPDRPTPESTFAAIERFRPTLFFGVPTLFARQLAELPQWRPNLSSVRACVSAGEALPARILETWRQLTGIDILDGVGSTEAGHIYIANRPGDVTPGASGRPVSGYQAKVVDDEGAELPNGAPGRLFLRGESIAKSYWRNPKPIVVDGWFDTGDIYCIKADGAYSYSGRSSDMLKVGGIWCSPIEIEAALIQHPYVLEAAVVGREDADGLVKPEAWIVPKQAEREVPDGIEADLVRHCKALLAPYKYPRWVRFVSELPKTATGKIQRFALRQQLEQASGAKRPSAPGRYENHAGGA